MVILMVICTCVSSSDLTEDRKECQDKLISLSPCLPFVSGDSKKAPTPQCCTQLRNGINKTRRCLCVLVKDRNEPGLGFKVNATLALILPSVCHAPSNASDCPGTSLLPLSTYHSFCFTKIVSCIWKCLGNILCHVNMTHGTLSQQISGVIRPCDFAKVFVCCSTDRGARGMW